MQLRLLLEPGKHRVLDSWDMRQRGLCQGGQRRDAGCVEFLNLAHADIGHTAHMVGCLKYPGRLRSPAAVVPAKLRTGLYRWIKVPHISQKGPFQGEIVVDEVGGPKAAAFTGAEPEQHRIRPVLLNGPEQVGGAAELNQTCRTRLRGEGGIPRLVAIVAQSGRPSSPHQKVGPAEKILGSKVLDRAVL